MEQLLYDDLIRKIASFLNPIDLIDFHSVNKHMFSLFADSEEISVGKWLIKNKSLSPHEGLMQSCSEGNMSVVKYLIDYRNTKDIGRRTQPRFFAQISAYFRIVCMHGHTNIAKYLYEFSIKIGRPIRLFIDQDIYSRLALQKGHYSLAEWIVSTSSKEIGPKYADESRSIYIHNTIWAYVRFGKFNMIDFGKMMDVYRYCGTKVIRDIVQQICEKYDIKIIEEMFDMLREKNIAFSINNINIAMINNIDKIKWLIECGKSINERPVIGDHIELLCCSEKFNILKYLIEELAEKEGYDFDLHQSNEYIFAQACMVGEIEIAKWLLKKGEDFFGRIDIHAYHDRAFKYAYIVAHHNPELHRKREIQCWLISLADSYGPIPADILDKYYGKN